MFKKIAKKIIPRNYHDSVYKLVVDLTSDYSEKFYSQEGEDMVLKKLLKSQKKGFYIDIGAHHPKRFSNTFYFYKKGWNGINIDAMPGSMEIFRKKRPRDINLEIAVSDKAEILNYYAFDEPAINGFSDELSSERESEGISRVLFKKKIKTVTLADVLEKFLPKSQQIDFMSIDVEGLDFNVLKSNNWEKYRPEFILIELLNNDFDDIFKNEIYCFLNKKAYKIVAKLDNTVIFKSNLLSSKVREMKEHFHFRTSDDTKSFKTSRLAS